MGVTVTGKLNKSAHQFQAGESVGFGVRIGQQYYDRKTKQKEWTNYKAVIFAKNPAMIGFLQGVLIEGAVIELTGDTQSIEVYDGQNGPQYSIEVHNAKLGFVNAPEQPQQQASVGQPPAQQSYAQPSGQAPVAQPPGNGFAPSHPRNAGAQQAAVSPSSGMQPADPGNFDDDIPF